jgi:hypothetical protein
MSHDGSEGDMAAPFGWSARLIADSFRGALHIGIAIGSFVDFGRSALSKNQTASGLGKLSAP